MGTNVRTLGWGRSRLLLVLCAATMGVWWLLAAQAVPSIIRAAYNGQSVPFINGVIAGQSEHPVEFYLGKWNSVAASISWMAALFWALALATTSPGFFRRFVGPATPGTLGAIRMWTCTVLLITTLWDDLGSTGLLPLGLRQEMGLMGIFKLAPFDAIYTSFLTSESSLRAFQRLTEVLLFCGAIGLGTRLVIPLCTICAFVMNGILREYSGFWHQNLVPIYVLAVLSFTPCGDGYSFDRLRRIARGAAVPRAEEPTAVYGWARYACWVPIAMTYAAAGLSKLRADGLGWASAGNIRALFYEQTLYPRAGNYSISLLLAPAPDWVFNLLGAAALFAETLFITVLVSRVARRIFPALNIAMHVGIVFLLNIVFFDLMLLLLVFYDFGGIRRRIGRWLGERAPMQVLYDGLCPLCVRTIRVLAALDVFSRLEFQDFRRMNLEEFNKRHSLSLTADRLEKEMAVRAGSTVTTGFEAYRSLARVLPALWPLVPVLFLPGAARVGERVYEKVASHRLRLLKCDETCIVQPASPSPRPEAPPVLASRSRVWPYGIAVAALIAVLGFFWFRAIEFYPFTAVQMFTRAAGHTVTYYRTLSHRSNGTVATIHLEDTLDVWATNSRYEPLFSLCFHEGEQKELCRETLSILGGAYNKKVPPADRITRLEVQRWKWDFVADPDDPDHGELEASFVGDVAPDGPSATPARISGQR